jgi:ribosome-associated heat shock protein Hsp15
MNNEVRMDKWLWALRLYKTRSQAIEACRGGHVKIDGQSVKPARPVRIGEVITARIGPMTRTVRIRGLLERRVGASLVSQYLEDQTPAAEYEKARERRAEPQFTWGRGRGRPTKKDRRQMARVFGLDPES